MDVVNLAQKLESFQDYWSPRVVGELNGQHVKVVKMKGEFDWHYHEKEDELFLVISGELCIELRDRMVRLGPGEFYIVPRGVQHRPIAAAEVHALLLEPASTRNTGNVVNERTVKNPQRI